MGFTEELKVLLVGNATSAIAAFQETGSASEALQAKSTITGQALEKLGLQGVETGTLLKTAAVGASVVGGAALAKFALDGVQHFADMTGEVRTFQRTLGGTAEDSSKLAAATARMGIDTQTAVSAFGKLAKSIGEGKDTLAQWGVEIARNKDGSVNMAETLANISEKYASIQDPAQRAAFASENFGKGFQGINALLGQGKTNLEDFYKVAAEHHEIFNQGDLNRGLQYNRSIADLKTAFQGLEIEVGGAVIPLMTGLAHGLEGLVELFDKVAGSETGMKAAGVALGAGLGALVGGPVGALVGGGLALAGVLGSSGDAAGDFAKQVDGVTTSLQSLDAEQAVRAFNKLTLAAMDASHVHRSFFDQMNDNAHGFGSLDDGVAHLTKAGAAFQAFRDIASKDPASGQLLIDDMKARGIATDIYSNELAILIGKQSEHKTASDKASASVEAQASATDKSTGALKAMVAATKEEIAAEKELTDVVDSAANADLGLATARDAAVKSVSDLAAAERDHGAQSGEYHDQLYKTEAQVLSTAEASRKAAEADEKQAEAIQGLDDPLKQATAGNAAYRGELAGLAAGLAPDSPLRIYIEDLIQKLDATATPRAVTIATDQASQAVAALAAQINEITSNPHEVEIFVRGALGGL